MESRDHSSPENVTLAPRSSSVAFVHGDGKLRIRRVIVDTQFIKCFGIQPVTVPDAAGDPHGSVGKDCIEIGAIRPLGTVDECAIRPAPHAKPVVTRIIVGKGLKLGQKIFPVRTVQR